MFRKPGAERREGSHAAPTRTADQQPELFAEPSSVATAAPPPGSEAEPDPERDLPSYLGSAVGLRNAGRFEEAERLLVEAIERFPTEPRPQIELAVVSHARRDWPEAVQRWEIVRGEFPNEPLSYSLAAAALREAGRFDEAEALAESARERFPGDFIALLEYARAAERRDPARGLEGWQELRDRCPERSEGYAGLAAAFRALGRLDEADAVLAESVERFPESRHLALDFARIAEARRDWPRALERWSAVRDAFPDEGWGHVGSAVALRELRQPEAAESVLTEAVERFPAEPRLHIDRALLAHHRGDWHEAEARWAEVRARLPDQTIAIWHGAAALTRLQKYEEAEALLAEGRERFPNDLGIAMENASLATHRREWAEALRRWQSVRDEFPDNPRGYTGTAMVQRELGWLSEAEATLAEAAERFPRDLPAQIDYARLAEIRRERAEALRRWQAVRGAFPDEAAGYTGAAALLREDRRFEEAERLLAEAAMRFPNGARLDIDRALLAHHRRDWSEAARRWEQVRARLPDEHSGYLLGAAALRELRQLDAVQLVLSAGLERFPAEAGLQIEFALLAEARGEWAQAAESWAALRIAFPQDVRGFTFGARALRQLGRLEEAEDLLGEAIHRFPRDLGVLTEYAWAAFNQNRWPEAETRFAEILTRFPEAPVGYIGSATLHRFQSRFDEAE
ncbi:MAG TPA: tetratricopeptide repeat protein, partial [Stellaceae bacterium]